ncbi:MAG TPA: hypothetical protein VEK76_11110 [Candidatus Binatia bacterium]|nr:hypothetical protein [Candidatus Binatia bacterium]
MYRRRLDPVSLIFGLVFAGVGAFLVAGQENLLVQLRWAWPIALIALAVILLAWLAADRLRGPVDGPPR